MRAEVQIVPPYPPGIGKSYGTLGFAKYGVCVWEYSGGYFGPVHWINWLNSCFEPEYSHPVRFHFHFNADVFAFIQLVWVPPPSIPDIILGGSPTNLLTGKGVPVRPPH